MLFVPRGTYRPPPPIHVPLGQPVSIPATTVHVAYARGREVGYFIEDGIGTQHANGVAK